MARLIVKSPYIKCGGGKSAGGYLKYIATRERVEIIPDDRPPTRKQEQLIAKLVKDFPDAKGLMEYEEYTAHPTKANASAFITLTLEENWNQVQSVDGYAGYIALRPRAERLGEHGLFGDDDNVDLNKVMNELDHYTGNVWTHIISLHREDAERLGYNHAEAWRTLLRTNRNDIAAAMKIPPEDFRWYAAFHDEGNHPHVHMMAWSTKPNQAYLSKDGIRQIKSTLTNQIFRQELLHVYEQKSKSRDELVAEARKAMLELAQAMQEMACDHPEAEQILRRRKEKSITQWIFPDPVRPELPLSPDCAYTHMKAILHKAGLPDIRFHDLRHTFATHAIASGVDAKTLSGILGHTNASFTLDTYTHVTPDMQKAASGIVGGFMEDLLGKGLRPWQRDGKAEPAR